MPTEKEESFAAYLAGLAQREDRATLAHLRRGLGKPPGTAPEMFPHIVRWTQGLADWQADMYYLVASLFALNPRTADGGNLGDTCRQTHDGIRRERREHGSAPSDQQGPDSLERRFVAMLNADLEDVDGHLRHAVALAEGQEVGVNWAQLLYDLRHWDHPERFVQRNWANAYWGGRGREQETKDETVTTTA